MSEYGIKIKNYEAASIYEYTNGIRYRMDETDAMLTNSLFKDFLMENGLKLKGESTRDIICLQFSYGTKSYDEYSKKMNIDPSLKDKCVKISKQDLRTLYYKEGVTITYPKGEKIHYRMLYRTPGKAKKGTCMFIRDRLYERARKFLWMGIKMPKKNAPIVEIGAYSSLITSTIVGKVQIKPEQILVVNDVDSFFDTTVVKVKTNELRQCIAERAENYRLKNTMFDGQALIDSSIFPEWGDGYVLLRHHFMKAAAFCTHIQCFMQDRFGDKYETAEVTDMFGRQVRVKDIRLITTENALKFLKFNVSFDYWADWVRANDSYFGIVKTAHPSKLGNVQRMSYQMNNALDMETMEQTTAASVDYINSLKADVNVFLDFLRKNQNFSNDYEVLLALVEHNPRFVDCEYFRERKINIIKAYILNFKSGRSLQNADNLVIVGSPYAMLLHAVGDDPFSDPTFSQESEATQCWTARFDDGEYLAEFRNPFNSRNNLGYLHNVHHEYFDKYFDFGKLIIAVNMNGTDFQDKNNGSDQDSDSIYTTNQPEIVAHARYCTNNYPTIVNLIPKMKNIYDSSMESFARVDNNLAAAQRAIGESSNLAQLALTYTYNFEDQKYSDYVAILSVIAQVAIDNAKRAYDIDLTKEIQRIRADLNIEENGLPSFWQITKKDKRKARTDAERHERNRINKEKIKNKVNPDLVCPMNYIFNISFDYKRVGARLPIGDFFISHPLKEYSQKSKKVEALIEKYSIDLKNYNNSDEDDTSDNYFLLRSDFDQLIEDIRKITISKETMSWLINRAFVIGLGVKREKVKGTMKSYICKNRPLLLKTLYTVNAKNFLCCFKNEHDMYGGKN